MTHMDRLGIMLARQLMLQRSSFKVDPHELTQSGDMSYIRDMTLGAIMELTEALNEVTWKPWVTTTPSVHVENYKKELVDVWHFLMNLMLAVDMTADELFDAYSRKHDINVARQRDGYDGESSKCPRCKRALDDVTLNEIRSSDGSRVDKVLCQCGESLPLDWALKLLTD